MPGAAELPPGFTRRAMLDPFNRRRSWIGLAIVGLLLIGTVVVLIFQVAAMRRSIHPEWLEEALRQLPFAAGAGPLDLLLSGLVMLAAFYLTVALHEAIHGAAFWLFSGRRPTFGIRRGAAFAAAHPDALLTRNQYLAATHAPLVLVTAAGLLLLLVLPPGPAALAGFMMVANAAGAPSDLRVAGWLYLQPPGSLVRDGEVIDVFAPVAARPPAAPAPPPGDDTTLSMARANLSVPLAAAGAGVLLLGPFVWLWGAEAFWSGFNRAFTPAVLVPLVLVLVVVHEALHAAGYRLGGAPREALHFGVNWKVLSPFAGCRAPLRASAYRRAVLLPSLVLGVAPGIAALATGSGWLVSWAFLMLVMAAGDFAALWAMRRVPGEARVLDHPTRVGCRVVDGEEVGVAA